MKNKSSRHKNENTFKFIPFSERINNIDVDIFHKVSHENEELLDDHECIFHQTLDKWNVLNLTEYYDHFKRDLHGVNVITLPQLIFNKEKVKDILIKHISLKNELALQPFLDLVVALSKDLRQDFYPFYHEFFKVFVELLRSNKPEQLEWTFHCLAYLNKFLWRPMINDIGTVFKNLLPLLGEDYPEYINNFAAESFAFVARKVKDFKKFLVLLFTKLGEHKDGVTGCGRLLYEVLKGITGHFHSCATTILPILFQFLGEKAPFEVLQIVIQHITNNINPEKGSLLYTTILASIKNEKTKLSTKSDSTQNLEQLLILLGQSLEYKSGKFLNDSKTIVIQEIQALLQSDDLPTELILTVVQISIVLLHTSGINLTQAEASTLVHKVLNYNEEKVLLFFVEKTVDYPLFKTWILPRLLKFITDTMSSDEENVICLDSNALELLTKILLHKAPLCLDSGDLNTWIPYTIDFGTRQQQIITYIMGLLTHDHWKKSYRDMLDVYVSRLIIIPHLKGTKETERQLIHENIKSLISYISTENLIDNSEADDNTLEKALFSLLLNIETYVHISNAVDRKQDNDLIESLIKSLLGLCSNYRYIWALKTLDLFLTFISLKSDQPKEILSKELLLTLHPMLKTNFNSPFHELRLHTTHIYALFEPSIGNTIDNHSWNVFSICYQVEATNPQISTYRDQLQALEKFNYEKAQMQLAQNSEFHDLPLRYLCGVLYMNFKLLWDPVVSIISSHANGMGINLFWTVFVEELRTSASNMQSPPEISYNSLYNNACLSFIHDVTEKSRYIQNNADFLNYRTLLWKAMTTFSHVAEARNRDVVDLFLSFVNEEYMRINSDIAYVVNIKEENLQAMEFDITLDEVNSSEITQDQVIKEKVTSKQKYGGKVMLKLLLHHLHVFGKIKSPKSMYKEPELYKIYFEFLAHKNSEVQKAILGCIMTYKNKNVTPYSTNLYNLIDEKNLKHELVHFKLDKESSPIQPQHREDLIPLVLKIVYSKMIMKTGGKAGGQQRRNMIFRFLSGCMEEEMLLFIQMAFKYYEKYFNSNDDLLDLIRNVTENVDLQNFIPPKRLQSTENMFQVVFAHFGNHMDSKILTFVLKILLCIGATLKGALIKQSEVHSGFLAILRSLRTSSIKLVEQFFSRFDYSWDIIQIDAVFEVFVWPYINKLEIEGIHSPTTLLKLLGFWASNPKFYQLLVKHKAGDASSYPLEHLIGLLMNPKCHLSVNNFIMEIIENLLKLTLDDGEMMIPVANALPIEESILARLKVPENNLNYGSCILLPHVPNILAKMKEKLLKKKKTITKRDLVILSRISELVWEADISDSTLELLVPIVVKKSKLGVKEEDLIQLLTTVKNLLHNVDNSKKHLKLLSPLFGYVREVTCRKILCAIITDISIKTPEFLLINEIMTELNAFNAKWIDQPDFDRRLAAFRKIENLFKDGNLTLELSILLVYNCLYTVSVEKDLSLKECALDCLKVITPPMVHQHHRAHKEYILDQTLFPIIKNGFKTGIRGECISLLGLLARECSETHVILKDLNKLTNKNDLEVDFFENLVHLQLHRHGRALLKVKEVFSQEEITPNIRTLTQYLIPLATHYLCNPEFVSKHTLVDSACEVIATCARLMPWHNYEALLKLYLSKLMHDVLNQKQLVKIVVYILDSYHYDLGKGVDTVDFEGKSEIVVEEGKADDIKIVDGNNKEDDDGDADDTDEDEEEEQQDDESEEDVEEMQEIVKPYNKTTVLCHSAAKRVIRIIKTILLPQLNRALAMKTTHESTHKLNYKRATREEREDEDLVRIPITLAVVKLLQKLPKALLDRNLPGVIMKLCTFLKTKLESVRRTARETLQKILLALGPGYLRVILGEMAGLQYKGFQMHVLVFTVHALLNTLKPYYEPKHIDDVICTVLEFCMKDLFGALAEERDVAKITNKTAEASTPKSYDTLQILAQFITEKCMLDMIMPIKDILGSSHSLKVVNKAEECLKQIALGLVDNKFIEVESILQFAYGTASKSIPDLLYKEKIELSAKESEKLARKQPDCFIIPKAPVGRSGVRVCKVRNSQNANAHLFVEFGLKLCNLLLKRDKLKDGGDYSSFIDPFVEILKNCITTPHIKLNTISLQCMEWMLKYDLPSLKENIKEITKSLFSILHKYASAGLKKGDNFDLVVAAFKTMSVLVRDVKYHVIDTNQLKVLLLYVEQDLHNHERQATAFGLLKAIIARKLIVPELYEIIMKVGELSITSEFPHVRQQCRIVYHHYVMDYPLGTKIEKYVGFYLAQMSYELQTGRESALDMMLILINSFPINVLKNFSGTFFTSIGARLVNDDVPSCRRLAAKCVTTMLQRLDKRDRDPLFEMITIWMKDKKILHKTLSAQLCGLLITLEKEQFESRIDTLIPIVLKQFNKENDDAPGRFVRVHNDESEGFIKEKNRDHHLYQVLQMLLKLCAQCPSFLQRTSDIENLSMQAQGLLAYPHDWVRLGAAQFLGHILGAVDIPKLAALINKRSKSDGYLYSDPNNNLRSLVLDLCAQLQPSGTKQELAEQVIKNLILIARVLQHVPVNKAQAQDEDIDDEEEITMRVNLLWLVKRIRRAINMEIVENSSSTVLRTELFKFIAALLTIIDISILRPMLHHLLAPLVREMVTKEKSTEELLQLCREVSAIVKSKIGKDEYTTLLARIENQLTIRRAERKRQRTQLAVTDPELFAKKKLKHHEKKKELKKKKMSQRKGLIFTKPLKGKKIVEIEAEDD